MYSEQINNNYANFNPILSPYPNGTLLGGNGESSSKPRPMYNMMPHHNLPTYGLNMNTISNEHNSTLNNNSYPKNNELLKEIMKYKKNNNIVIIII